MVLMLMLMRLWSRKENGSGCCCLVIIMSRGHFHYIASGIFTFSVAHTRPLHVCLHRAGVITYLTQRHQIWAQSLDPFNAYCPIHPRFPIPDGPIDDDLREGLWRRELQDEIQTGQAPWWSIYVGSIRAPPISHEVQQLALMFKPTMPSESAWTSTMPYGMLSVVCTFTSVTWPELERSSRFYSPSYAYGYSHLSVPTWTCM